MIVEFQKESLARTLSPLSSRKRDQGIVRPISRVAISLFGDRAFEQAIQEAAVWMRNRSPAIPKEAIEGHPFDVGGGGVNPAKAILLQENDWHLWSAILDFPDNAVPQRTWVTEISVGKRDGETAFGARLLNVTRGEDVAFLPSRPGVVRQILEGLSAGADGRRIEESVTPVDTAREIDSFFELLTDTNRSLPIVAVSRSDRPGAIQKSSLISAISGIAHLFELSEQASWALTERFGAPMSVFNGAARIYRRSFAAETSDPFDHPLFIVRSPDDSPQQFGRLTRFVFGISVRPAPGTDFPRFSDVRSAVSQKKSAEAKSSGVAASELVELYEDEIERLAKSATSQRAEFDELLAVSDRDREDAERTADEARAEVLALRSRIAVLEAGLRNRGQDIPTEQLSSYADIGEWAQKNLSDRIWIAPKAIRETAKNAQYRDLDEFSSALIMLRDFYVPMRRDPGSKRRDDYQAELNRLGLYDQPCFSTRDTIYNYPSYSVTYSGSVYWCMDHIKRGGGTDPRSFFRIYYSWHDEEKILLIGHMPTHLDNKVTN